MLLQSIRSGEQHPWLLMPLAVVLLGGVGTGCQDAGSPTLTDAREAALTDTIRAQVEEMVRHHDQLQADAYLHHVSDDVQAFVFGRHYSGAEFEKWFRKTVATQTSVSAEMINPQITVLGPRSAVASFRYRAQVVDTTGSEYQASGVQTYAFERRAGNWRAVQAQIQGGS